MIEMGTVVNGNWHSIKSFKKRKKLKGFFSFLENITVFLINALAYCMVYRHHHIQLSAQSEW